VTAVPPHFELQIEVGARQCALPSMGILRIQKKRETEIAGDMGKEK
jgi:hypothetical protein